MNIRMVGIDHNMAPLSCREAFSFTKVGCQEAVQIIGEQSGVKGCVLISTCNRTELWISGYGQWGGTHREMDPYELLCRLKGLDLTTYKDYFVMRENREAINHLLQLTCGFDSKIFGEDQIISQIREALQLSRQKGCTDTALEKLFQTALSAGKKVKTEVQISRISRTSANQMLTILKSKFENLNGIKCLIIGNGQMGRLIANTLLTHGAEVSMTLRRPRHCMEEQRSVIPEGCRMISYDNRIQEISEHKVIVSATMSPHHTLKLEEARECLGQQSYYMFDFAVPRDIDPRIGELENVEIYDIDSMGVSDLRELNGEGMELAFQILQEYQEELIKWFEFRKHVGKIQGIVERVVEDTVERFSYNTEKLESNCPISDINEVVEESVQKSIGKILYGLKETLPQDIWNECINGLHKAAMKETLKH
ncbi:glutamyl-tRNA reductase [Clostridium aminobutyricum]|uniref:Glutamyl-tRNA reductase n=1 Tax=Clostridium aminobutyricum TaxID=33953 RepID=A0A939D5X6_CLOAM|nr:glutamyl-tRNA reductase [Clostridium aminobutyricum]MBN7771904.1 glutamyl-tRNA reductase [Clostridium aminobutyricum]